MTYPQFKRQFQKLVQPCSLCYQDVLLPTAAGEPVVMLVANLPKLLRHVVAESPAYKTALLAGLQQDHVLKPVLYHDEAQGGNLLAHVKKKKATLFYICFQQLANAFHLEQAWLPVAFLTHEECDKVDGKLSTATARALRHLWQPCAGGCSIEGLSCDIAVQLHSTCLMLCDFDAQRACTGTVGSAGMVCCAFCSNVLKKNSGISDSNFVEYHEWDRRKFLARSAGDYKDAADKLRLLNKKKKTSKHSKRAVASNECFMASCSTMLQETFYPSPTAASIPCTRTIRHQGVFSWELGLLWAGLVQETPNLRLDMLKQLVESSAWCCTEGTAGVFLRSVFEPNLWDDEGC